ncbi:MlaE family ABC transporter permease [Megamonas hypermegale]|uniref:MlaE family ABC transporter permease n=1 Tax=Megamonas hypermegale TaxID=158847 RepID=UPI00255CFECA|nr:ABC transporter permease [Megamonas hypermegale]
MIIKFLESIGAYVINCLETLGQFTILVRDTVVQLRHMPRFRHVFQQMSHLGVDTLPIIALTMLFTGMVLTLQTATEFIRLGAQSTVGGIVTIAVGRELGPVLAGVVTAGRVGAAITAEISTMKVTEQIDALKVMATNPIGYLVVPRLIACMCMLPLLVVFGDVIGSLGGWMIANYYDIDIYMYINSIDTFVEVHDVVGGLIKAIVFGAIVAIVGCYYGLNAQNGAEGVGKATTRSVVVSIIVIFFSNCLLSMVLYR